MPNQYVSTNFFPKFGFAYQVFQNTVVRGAATLAGGPVDQSMGGMQLVNQQGYFPTFRLHPRMVLTLPFIWTPATLSPIFLYIIISTRPLPMVTEPL